MNDEWKAFLVRDGARVVAGQVLDFGDVRQERMASLNSAAVVDLSDYFAVIRASGADALSFLNGQLTNDLRTLDDRHHLLAAYCNPKGRAISLFRIWRDTDDWLLLLPDGLSRLVLDRLELYVLRAKVSLELDANLAIVGLIGPKAGEVLKTVDGTSTPGLGELVHLDGRTILGIDGSVPRNIVVLPIAARKERWAAYRRQATAAGLRIWKWHDIQAGQPTVLPETSEAFVPQMLNLDLLGGIHFNKGCYPGQEIVARTHYLGKLKQRLFRLSLTGNIPPAPGTDLYAADHGAQSAGTVVDAVTTADGQIDLLAVVQIASAETEMLHLGKPDGPPLHLADGPRPDTD